MHLKMSLPFDFWGVGLDVWGKSMILLPAGHTAALLELFIYRSGGYFKLFGDIGLVSSLHSFCYQHGITGKQAEK